MKGKLWIGVLAVVVVIAAVGYFFSGDIFQPPETSSSETGKVREFTITAKQWKFNLTMIEVDMGDTVRLKITGLDDGVGNGHGFRIPGFGKDVVIREGQKVTIEFVADKTGTFPFLCSVFCGAGHSTMTGTLVVS